MSEHEALRAAAETSVRIALPLPLDLASSIMRALGTMYPNATVANDPTELVFHVPDGDRFSELDEDAMASLRRTPAAVGATLEAIDAGTFRLSAPEYIGNLLGGLAIRSLDGAQAPNYLVIRLSNGGQTFDIVVCRPGRPGPHELLEAAEARTERYAAALRHAGIDPTDLE